MPRTEVVAVVALVRLTGAFAEIGVVAPRAGRPVLMVSRHGEGDVSIGTPALCVHCLKVGQGATGILVVAEGEHGVWLDSSYKFRRVVHLARIRFFEF